MKKLDLEKKETRSLKKTENYELKKIKMQLAIILKNTRVVLFNERSKIIKIEKVESPHGKKVNKYKKY